MPTLSKFCPHCGKVTLHNESGKKTENAPRCTICAQPFGTGPKKEKNEAAGELAKKPWYVK